MKRFDVESWLYDSESWYGTDSKVWFVISLILTTLLLVAGLLASSPLAQACDPGNYYDPMHQMCAPYAPTNCPPEYWQACAYPQQGPTVPTPSLREVS